MTSTAEAMIARAVRRGSNPDEAVARFAELTAAHAGHNLAHALVYEGFATERQALTFADSITAG